MDAHWYSNAYIGMLAEAMKDAERALSSYESALRHNPYSSAALTAIATLCRNNEQYTKAAEYLQRILSAEHSNGEIWGALGHCYLMMDDLQKAYAAYQQALYHLPNPQEPKLWYGIGVLYDRYGSWEHAEEAFSCVLKVDPHFEKNTEIYFRLGVIYKQLGKYDISQQCFQFVLSKPPIPLTINDVMFQIGHVHELKKEYVKAKETYEKILEENKNHAKALQQLGWLYQQPNASFISTDTAIEFLQKAIESDQNDPQSRYLLGRCFMSQQKFSKAYDAYQQAVYRDSRNPTFWCSIGVLYYQINQQRDALDAYSRAIRLNPYIPEVWYNLGTLYESCNNQVQDAIDAYQKSSELDSSNVVVQTRLNFLKTQQKTGAASPLHPPPHPTDMNPNSYTSGGTFPQIAGSNNTNGHVRPTMPEQQMRPPRDMQVMRPPGIEQRRLSQGSPRPPYAPVSASGDAQHYRPYRPQYTPTQQNEFYQSGPPGSQPMPQYNQQQQQANSHYQRRPSVEAQRLPPFRSEYAPRPVYQRPPVNAPAPAGNDQYRPGHGEVYRPIPTNYEGYRHQSQEQYRPATPIHPPQPPQYIFERPPNSHPAIQVQQSIPANPVAITPQPVGSPVCEQMMPVEKESPVARNIDEDYDDENVHARKRQITGGDGNEEKKVKLDDEFSDI